MDEIRFFWSEAEGRGMFNHILDRYGAFSDGKITREEWEKVPRRVWVRQDRSGASARPVLYEVLDNRDGNAWTEDFTSLDGALMYALCIEEAAEIHERWDYDGALRDRGLAPAE